MSYVNKVSVAEIVELSHKRGFDSTSWWTDFAQVETVQAEKYERVDQLKDCSAVLKEFNEWCLATLTRGITQPGPNIA